MQTVFPSKHFFPCKFAFAVYICHAHFCDWSICCCAMEKMQRVAACHTGITLDLVVINAQVWYYVRYCCY